MKKKLKIASNIKKKHLDLKEIDFIFELHFVHLYSPILPFERFSRKNVSRFERK